MTAPSDRVETLIVESRYKGPPGMGNGGYVAGCVAELLCAGPAALSPHDAVEITLRAPTPLDTTMQVRRDGPALSIHHGDTVVAVGGPTKLDDFDIPAPPTWDEALALQPSSPSFRPTFNSMLNEVRRGAHPICFCCGDDIARGEGLHVYSAAVPGTSMVAAAWQCPPAYGVDGFLPPSIIWTALDCPGVFAWYEQNGTGGLLGRISGRIIAPVPADERCVVIGWTMGSDGRKLLAGTALFDSTGALHACTKQVWFPIASK